MFQDASFLQSVLGSLPGVDPNDPRIRSVLDSLPTDEKKGEEKKGDASTEESKEHEIDSFAPQGTFGVENLINTILMNIDIPNRETSAKNQPF